MTDDAREARLGRVVGGVVRQAVRDAGASGIVILDDGSAEARLAHRWCEAALGRDGVIAVAAPPVERAAELARWMEMESRHCTPDAEVVAREAHRTVARTVATTRHALTASPANKTTLLLSGTIVPEPLLPLGDLYASQVRSLAGEWSAPPDVHALAERAGGIDRLDAALQLWAEERVPAATAFADLSSEAADAVRSALEAARFARRHVGLVPKLTARTLGIDLFC